MTEWKSREPAPMRVLFVAGLGRSGSTLFEQLLGQVPGFVALGEVVHLWERGLRADERCQCGEPFSRCGFWQAVGGRAFGGWDRLDVNEVLATKAKADRTRHIPALSRADRASPVGRAAAAYGGRLAAIYRAAAGLTGSSVVVDSSKHSSTAYLLARTPGIDLRVVHVVRDSPAVAYSWSKSVPRPEAAAESPTAYMPVYSPAKTALLWTVHNLLVERLPVPRQRLSYEEFTADPRGALDAAVWLAGATPPAAYDFLDGHRAQLRGGHSVAGNPVRFRRGAVAIRRDEEWRRRLPAHRRRLVTTLTLPLRVHYGYGGRAA